MEKTRLPRSARRYARDILLLAVGAGITYAQRDSLSRLMVREVDWSYLVELADFQCVAPLVYKNLADSGLGQLVPPMNREKLENKYRRALSENIIFSEEMYRVLSVLCEKDIDVISLKGPIMAQQLYGNPGLRNVSDIDILVKPEHLADAGAMLLKMGYEKSQDEYNLDHPFHEVYCRQSGLPIYIELHWELEDPNLLTLQNEVIWQRAQRFEYLGKTVKVLSHEDNLLFLCDHLIKNSGQSLRYLCDITAIIQRFREQMDWEYITRTAHSWGIAAAVYFSLLRSAELLGVAVPAGLLQALRPKPWRRRLLGFIFDRRLFTTIDRQPKLRLETFTLVRSLMMERPYRMVLVMARFRRGHNNLVWARTGFWAIIVFLVNLWSRIVRLISGGDKQNRPAGV